MSEDKDKSQIIDDYLISSVANDCSIMIALQETSDNSSRHIKTDFGTYACSVSVIDLDKKSGSKIKSHFEEIQKSLSVYNVSSFDKVCNYKKLIYQRQNIFLLSQCKILR